MNQKIIQIIPAQGWCASIKSGREPIIAWALVEDDEGDRGVVGLITDSSGWIHPPSLEELYGYEMYE